MYAYVGYHRNTNKITQTFFIITLSMNSPIYVIPAEYRLS